MARILVIEDNAANLRLAAFMLRGAGYEVIMAADAADGLAAARERLPDLVLMDVQLPDMDGLEATRRLKADPATAAIPVIALTAFAMKGDEERIVAAGCDGYLAKPYSHKGLLACIAAALGGPAEG